MKSFSLGMIGFGAIGRSLVDRLNKDLNGLDLTVTALVRHVPESQGISNLSFVTDVEALLRSKPELVVECASQEALAQHGPTVLMAGVDLVAASIGALSQTGFEQRLESAAQKGAAQLFLPAGAVAGIDGLSAAKLAGLTQVTYVSRKPPKAWKGTHAETLCDLDSLEDETLLFEGTAREGSRLFPKNANVAATVALAGLGLDDTRIKVIADPKVNKNCHEVEAEGAFGTLSLRLANFPSPDNPKTSFLTILSLERAVRNRWSRVVI